MSSPQARRGAKGAERAEGGDGLIVSDDMIT